MGMVQADEVSPRLRIGLVADLHYADKAPAGNRFYRESLQKFAEAAKIFAEERVDCVIALGDVIDAGDSVDVERGYLKQVAQAFAKLPMPYRFVLGNHCVWSLTKSEFLEVVGQKHSYRSFDLGGYHFVLLDACFRSDGVSYGRKNNEWTDANIPLAELEWLAADLQKTPHKCIVCIHQRLDVPPPYGVKNGEAVRCVLEKAGNVLAVLQGHEHEGDRRTIGGIAYVTLKAMIEGSGIEHNAYATLEVLPGDVLRLIGHRRQASFVIGREQ
jgi:alkaline phosphatase